MQNAKITNEVAERKSPKELLTSSVRKWPIFLLTLFLCNIGAYFYIRYSIPKYISSLTFLVNDGKNESSPVASDLIENALNGNKNKSLGNEILQISSRNLMERTVAKNSYHISYFRKGRLHKIEIDNEAPFFLIPTKVTDSNRTFFIEVQQIDMSGGTISDNSSSTGKVDFQWGHAFEFQKQIFTLVSRSRISERDQDFVIRMESVSEAAARYSTNLTVKPFDPRTSAILLELKSENKHRGNNVLNSLYNEFSLSNLEDRNKIAAYTLHFIDERLETVAKELKDVEETLESYRGNNKLLDVKSQLSQTLTNATEGSKMIKELYVQKDVKDLLIKYFTDPNNTDKLVPSTLGLSDETLATLIAQYNLLQLKKEREQPRVMPNSIVMQDINTEISSLRISILESLQNIGKNLDIQANSLSYQNAGYESFISKIPHNERTLQQINRKQEITEGLYLYLLQKKEETAISNTSSLIPQYKQLDKALGIGPVEPNPTKIFFGASLLALFLAILFIYLRYLFSDAIVTKEDLLKSSDLPILGEIAHIKTGKKVNAYELRTGVLDEQIRSLRTAITLANRDAAQLSILLTSTSRSEGKSFVAMNLSTAYAALGKKVALVDLDLRKCGLSKSIVGETVRPGITDILNNRLLTLTNIQVHLDGYSKFDFYPAGMATTNANDLLQSENLSKFVDKLKNEYDYVFFDSPPIFDVSDALVIGQHVNAVLYIIRSGKTTENQMHFLNEKILDNSLRDVYLILNDSQKANERSNTGY